LATNDHSAQPRPDAPREVVMHDAGQWISGGCFEVPEDPPKRTMTTNEKTAAALAIPCPIHQVDAGEPCPLVLEACMARRTAALGDG
jgi:hypothetical protein